MEWSKLKNIILILLLFTNASLLILLGRPAWAVQEFQQQTRREAIALLQEKGIGVTEESVPKEQTLSVQTASRDLLTEKLLAGELLGETVNEELRGGEVYRYESASGTIQFHSDGSFSARLEPEAFPIGKDPVQAGLNVLRTLNFEGEVVRQADGQMTVMQYWKGVPLFQQQVTVCWNELGLTGLEQGTRLIGVPVEGQTQKTISVASALITFLNGLEQLGDVYSEIHTITQGYTTTTVLAGPMNLTPVWRIATDTGTYQLDMVRGVLSRTS